MFFITSRFPETKLLLDDLNIMYQFSLILTVVLSKCPIMFSVHVVHLMLLLLLKGESRQRPRRLVCEHKKQDGIHL